MNGKLSWQHSFDLIAALIAIVAVAVLLALVIAFLTGRRRGRSERAIVEVYRE